MGCLSTLTTLARLHVHGSIFLPPSLPSMTWLECLRAEPDTDALVVDWEAEEAWRQTQSAALPLLTRLTSLVLHCAQGPDLAAIAPLPRVQRAYLAIVLEPSPTEFAGPWLASCAGWGCLGRCWRRSGEPAGGPVP